MSDKELDQLYEKTGEKMAVLARRKYQQTTTLLSLQERKKKRREITFKRKGFTMILAMRETKELIRDG